MVKRLVVGLSLGLVTGIVLAVALVQGLGVSFLAPPLGHAGNAVLAYLAAAAAGGLVGLVAGKPIWSSEGKIESVLKAVFGTVLALGGMWALRRFGTMPMDLTALKAGVGPIGELPFTSLPIITGVLGAFFELDNTPSAKDDKEADAGKGKAAGKSKVRVAEEAEEAEEEEEEEEPKARKKR
jgi:hypothetical protein